MEDLPIQQTELNPCLSDLTVCSRPSVYFYNEASVADGVSGREKGDEEVQ